MHQRIRIRLLPLRWHTRHLVRPDARRKSPLRPPHIRPAPKALQPGFGGCTNSSQGEVTTTPAKSCRRKRKKFKTRLPPILCPYKNQGTSSKLRSQRRTSIDTSSINSVSECTKPRGPCAFPCPR